MILFFVETVVYSRFKGTILKIINYNLTTNQFSCWVTSDKIDGTFVDKSVADVWGGEGGNGGREGGDEDGEVTGLLVGEVGGVETWGRLREWGRMEERRGLFEAKRLGWWRRYWEKRGGNRGAPGLQLKGKECGKVGRGKGGLWGQEDVRNGGGTSGEWVGESPPGGKKFGLSRPIAFSRFLHLALLFWNQT